MASDARALAARIWAASGPADDSPGRVYLAQRWAWPPLGIGPDLPARVCWLAAERAPATCEATKWYGLPAGACGALVFAWCRLDAAPGEKGGAAVSLLAVNEAGERVPWFGARAVAVRTIGSCTGAVFEAHTGESNDPVHVAEREIDALALAFPPRYGPGRILAAGSGLRPIAEALSGRGGRGRGAGRHPRRLRRTDQRGGRTARLDGARRNARRGSRSVTASDGQGRGVPGVAARLWAAATCADATLARVYLDRRGCWHGRHVPGAPALPESVRWLARADASASNPAAGWHGLPPVAVSRAEPPADTTEAERAHGRTGTGGGFRR